ncbi:MAG TPA: NAD-dependent epimerase/dehydratase family protein [Planctomycetota bacterium]|nr:NAD-dependent epimerase/dehydratase family protein [Planctomycetota bacterium]
MPIRALVTGGGGFLGRAVVEMLLGRGDHVRILSRQRYPVIEALGADAVQGDIRNVDDCVKACMGMDVVIHTAALPGIWGDFNTYKSINVDGTNNLLVACKRRGVPKFVYTSSPSVVFDMKDECDLDENTPYPKVFFNPYSWTKAIAEEQVLKSNGQDGLLTCSLRPHLIWGPRDNHLIPRILERARKRQLRMIGKGQNKVDLTYIENAALAHVLAADAMKPNRVAGQAYFISDDKPVVMWEWINALLKKMNLPPVTKRVPVRVAYGAGWCFEKFYELLKKNDEPRMTRFLAKALSCSHYYNISKAKRDFGYKPRISNEEGLTRTVEYFSKKDTVKTG